MGSVHPFFFLSSFLVDDVDVVLVLIGRPGSFDHFFVGMDGCELVGASEIGNCDVVMYGRVRILPLTQNFVWYEILYLHNFDNQEQLNRWQ